MRLAIMKYEYDIQLSADVGNMLSPIGDMVNRVNDHLSTAGYDEKLSVRGRLFSMKLTTEHELTNDEKEKVKTTIIQTYNVMQPAWKVKVESFRRKSGNVALSVNQ